MRKAISLSPRLEAAAQMLGRADTVWDVGCDHGFLSAALLQSGLAEKVIASDISPASVVKARVLAERLGLSERMSVRAADGLSGEPPEGDHKIAVCGMGGELIAQMLGAAPDAARAAALIVMQPMRGEEELRRFLAEEGYSILAERVVEDDGRFYQLIAAKYGGGCTIPDWFPKGYYRFGWVMCEDPDDTLIALLTKYRAVYAGRLASAQRRGRTPQKLVDELAAVDILIGHIEGR